MGELTTEEMKNTIWCISLRLMDVLPFTQKKLKAVEKQYWLEEIGMPEALWVMECNKLGPLIVGIDSKGRNLFEETRKHSKEKIEAISKQTHCKSI